MLVEKRYAIQLAEPSVLPSYPSSVLCTSLHGWVKWNVSAAPYDNTVNETTFSRRGWQAGRLAGWLAKSPQCSDVRSCSSNSNTLTGAASVVGASFQRRPGKATARQCGHEGRQSLDWYNDGTPATVAVVLLLKGSKEAEHCRSNLTQSSQGRKLYPESDPRMRDHSRHSRFVSLCSRSIFYPAPELLCFNIYLYIFIYIVYLRYIKPEIEL